MSLQHIKISIIFEAKAKITALHNMNTTASTDNNLSKPNNDDDNMNNSNDILSSDNQPCSKTVSNEADSDNFNSNSQDSFNDNSIPNPLLKFARLTHLSL